MDALFLKIVNMSITASWLVLAVLVLRLALKKAPRAISCALWIIVALRLIMPFSFESALSLVPSAETIPSDFTSAEKPQIDSGIYEVDEIINPFISDILTKPVGTPIIPDDAPAVPDKTPEAPEKVPQTPDNDINEPSAATETPAKSLASTLAIVWAVGVFGMLVYMLASYLRIRLRVSEAVSDGDGIMICDSISSPFIFGVVRPRIYLPSSLNETDREYVLAHERAHLSRLDHLWKPLGFVLLAVHWFNPLLWLAYVLLCRDVELACDERVIRKMGAQIKKPYSEALVNCSMPRRMIAACPLAFGEVGVKGRIKAVLNYKKPAFWIIIVAVIAVIVTSICFLTDPLRASDVPEFGSYENYIKTTDLTMSEELKTIFEETVKAELKSKNYRAHYATLDYTVLGIYDNINTVTVYATAMYREYGVSDLKLYVGYEIHSPIAVTFSKYLNGFALVTCKVAENGEAYPEGFPESLKAASDPKKYEGEHGAACRAAALNYYHLIDSNVDFESQSLEFGFYPLDEVCDALINNGGADQVIENHDEALAYYTLLAKAQSEAYSTTGLYSDYETIAAKYFAKFKELYPEEFFEDRAVILVYIVTACYADRYEAQGVYYENGQLNVNVVITFASALTAINSTTVAVSVPREILNSCENIRCTIWDGLRVHS